MPTRDVPHAMNRIFAFLLKYGTRRFTLSLLISRHDDRR